MSIIYTWLGKTPQHAFFFCTFSCSRIVLLASTVPSLRCFLFLNAVNCRLHSVLDSAKHVCCGGPTALSYPSSIVKERRSSLSSIARQGIQYSPVSVHVMYEFLCMKRERKLTFLSVTDTYVRTYIVRIDPSFKASR